MRRPVSLFLAVPLLIIAAEPARDGVPAGKEVEALQGAWVMRAMEADGAKVDGPQGGEAVRLFFDGTKYTSKMGQTVIEEGTLTIDAGKSPAWMDLAPATGALKGQVLRGIFLLRGDSLVLCLATPPAERPTEFAARQGDHRIVLIFKR
jgi:uncharacterized protein (TIGR03067 family)